MSYTFSEYDKPLRIALHPLGFHIAVAFADRVKVYHVSSDTLQPCALACLRVSHVLTALGQSFFRHLNAVNYVLAVS